MISDERVEKAVEFLRDTSEQHAQAAGAVKFLEYKIKRIEALAFLEAEGSVAVRNAKAESSPEVAKAVEELRDVIVTERLLRDQRQAAELTISVWQTQNANQRSRNVF